MTAETFSHNPRVLVILGAICGDIIGSRYEFKSTKDLDFKLFPPYCRFTDDSVCTVALADSLINRRPFAPVLQDWCRRYPHAGYGGMFRSWICSDNPIPYNSWGNGSAMRVSAAGAIASSMEEAMILARKSAEITHNHPEGIKGAQATAAAIYMALRGFSKAATKEYIEKEFGYDLSRDYRDIQSRYSFDVSCQGSVPESIISFLVSDDYESTIRHAVALGGDSDTMAAIAGGIAAAYYRRIPTHILEMGLSLIPADMKRILEDFNKLTMTK